LENIDGQLELKNIRVESLDSGKNVKTGNQLAEEQKIIFNSILEFFELNTVKIIQLFLPLLS
jgi:hypothetical protein